MDRFNVFIPVICYCIEQDIEAKNYKEAVKIAMQDVNPTCIYSFNPIGNVSYRNKINENIMEIQAVKIKGRLFK